MSRTINTTPVLVPIQTTMTRVVTLAAAALLVGVSLAWAQAATQKPLADVAKAEEARRKNVKKPAKVYTNDSLQPDTSRPVPPPPPATPAPPAANASPANATPAAPAADAKPPAQDQTYWANRIKVAREQLQRTQIFADSLQSRINALTTDFVNRDDPAQRAKIEADRLAALAELERVKKELEVHTKAIAAIEDEARRAGVPAGWLRPGA